MRLHPLNFELPGISPNTHRVAVRASAVGALAAALILLGAAFVTGESRFLSEAIAPTFVAGLLGLLVAAKRERVSTMLAIGFGAIVIAFSTVGTEATALPMMLGLWTIMMVASLVVERQPLLFVLAGALLLALTPSLWADKIEGAVSAGVTLAVAFIAATVVVLAIRQSWARSEYRFERLFDMAPVALMEQDWSDAISYLGELGVETTVELRECLADIDVLTETVSRINVVRVNSKAHALMGLPAGASLTTLSRERVHAESADAFREQLTAVWSGQPRSTCEYRTYSYRDARPIWIRVETISTEINPHASRLIVAVTDITRLIEEQDSLAELVRSKDQFIASVSHELRTPLTGVLGLSSALIDGDITDAEERAEVLRLVRSQSQEISYLVEDLLVGARADIGTIAVRPEPVGLSDEVQAVFSTLGIDRPVEVEEPVRAWADPVRVRQIIRNLVVNAMRYGGPQQRVLITSAGDTAVFEMYDNGVGIPVEDRGRIFEPYGTAHVSNGTTESVGLGLAVSRQLARLMGGDLDYRYDEGSIFRLTLPSVARENRSVDREPVRERSA